MLVVVVVEDGGGVGDVARRKGVGAEEWLVGEERPCAPDIFIGKTNRRQFSPFNHVFPRPLFHSYPSGNKPTTIHSSLGPLPQRNKNGRPVSLPLLCP